MDNTDSHTSFDAGGTIDLLAKLTFLLTLMGSVIFSIPVHATQEENFDYFEANRTMIRHGVQAILKCNGLFTSNRTLEQVFTPELAYL